MKYPVLEEIRGKVLVSCQGPLEAEQPNPFWSPEHMSMFAQAAKNGGCVGFRANTPPNVKAIKEMYPDMPMIGIYKIVEEGSDVYITPNMYSVEALRELNCEIIALDGTNRKNARGQYAWEFIGEVKEKYPDQVLMADIATITDAKLSAQAGVDIIATTMCGYTEDTAELKTVCNFELLEQIKKECPDKFIICEGKIWTVDDAQKAFDSGADAIVIGTAITNPLAITRRFVENVSKK